MTRPRKVIWQLSFSAIARSVMISAVTVSGDTRMSARFSAIARSVMISAGEQAVLNKEIYAQFQCYSS